MSDPGLDREIMRALPDAASGGGWMRTPDVHQKLGVAALSQMPVVKTVQRHLERLCDDGLVESKKEGVALCWRKCASAGGLAARAGRLTRDEALALQVLRRFSAHQIPELVADMLVPVFATAQKHLDAGRTEQEAHYRRWTDKVEVESGGFALRYPVIDPAIFAAVSRALFSEHKLEMVYRPREKRANDTPRVVCPLGLVEVGGLVYLVASVPRHAQPAMYRLDRMSRALALYEPFSYPRDFSLSHYVRQQRQFDFMVEGEIRLALRFSSGAGDHLLETPFSDDQQTKQTGPYLEVQGTAVLSQRLRWWLRAFGPHIEVLAPASLRAELAGEAQQLAALYCQTPRTKAGGKGKAR